MDTFPNFFSGTDGMVEGEEVKQPILAMTVNE
jgi:hypothetical protein